MSWYDFKVLATNHIKIEQVRRIYKKESCRISMKIQLDIHILNIEEASVH